MSGLDTALSASSTNAPTSSSEKSTDYHGSDITDSKNTDRIRHTISRTKHDDETEKHTPDILAETFRTVDDKKPNLTSYLDCLSPVKFLEDIDKEIDSEFQAAGDGELHGIRQTFQERAARRRARRREYWKAEDIMQVEDTPYSRKLNVALLLLSFSYIGTMARIGFQKLLTYDNAYIYFNSGTIIWINFTSAFIVGFANNADEFWRCLTQGAHREINFKEIPLHTGITAGFCGCFSTFAGAIAETIFETINASRRTPNNAYGVMQFFAVILAQFGLSFFGLQLGTDFSYFVDVVIVPRMKPYVGIKTLRIIEYTIIFLGFGSTIANIILCVVLDYNYWYKKEFSIAMMFGLFGCYFRFKLMELNGRCFLRWFPTGTYLANVFGCGMFAIIQLLLHGYKNSSHNKFIVSDEIQRCIVNSLGTGFCGALSTFAAMVNEIRNMGNPKQRYTYFFLTFISCFIPAFLILAPYYWVVGIEPI